MWQYKLCASYCHFEAYSVLSVSLLVNQQGADRQFVIKVTLVRETSRSQAHATMNPEKYRYSTLHSYKVSKLIFMN